MNIIEDTLNPKEKRDDKIQAATVFIMIIAAIIFYAVILR